MSDWIQGKLGDFITLQRGFDITKHDMVLGKVPVISSGGISGYHNQSMAHGPGVITGRKGTLGKVFYVREDYWPHDTTLWVRDFKGNFPRFVYYFLQTLGFLGMDVGSSNPTLNRNHVHPIKVLWPPLPEQRAIAEILGSLDDKIEANRRQNETLEATARAIFKSWFVDFDPVHYKARGEHPPGMDAETAVLFPDSFEESELGMIPSGWGVGKLGDVVEFAYGKALKADNRIDGNIPVYGSNGLVGWHNEKLVDGPGIIVGRKGNPGTVTWIPDDFFPIDTTFYLVPLKHELPLEFLFFALELQDLPSLSADSAVPGLNRNIAYMSEFVLADTRLPKLFAQITQSMLEKTAHNNKESRTLAETRDALLPRLVSGEIRVGEVENFVRGEL
jgi:type I restriction enzyme, S subunit